MFTPHKAILSLTALSALTLPNLTLPSRGKADEPAGKEADPLVGVPLAITDLDSNYYSVRESASTKLRNYPHFESENATLFLRTYISGTLEQKWRLEAILEERPFDEFADATNKLVKDKAALQNLTPGEIELLGELYLRFAQHEIEIITENGKPGAYLFKLASAAAGEENPRIRLGLALASCRAIADIANAEGILTSVKDSSLVLEKYLDRLVLLGLANKDDKGRYAVDGKCEAYLAVLCSAILYNQAEQLETAQKIFIALEDYHKTLTVSFQTEAEIENRLSERITLAGSAMKTYLYHKSQDTELKTTISEITSQEFTELESELISALKSIELAEFNLLDQKLHCISELEAFFTCGNPQIPESDSRAIIFAGLRDAYLTGDVSRVSKLIEYLECNSKFKVTATINDTDLSQLALKGINYSENSESAAPHRHNLILYAIYCRLAAANIRSGSALFPEELYQLQKSKNFDQLKVNEQPELDLLKWFGEAVNSAENAFVPLESMAGQKILGLCLEAVNSRDEEKITQMSQFLEGLPRVYRNLLENHAGEELKFKYLEHILNFEFVEGPLLLAPTNSSSS